MVLRDRDIISALERGLIVIDPSPTPQSYSSTSVDLKLGTNIQLWKDPPPKGIEPAIFVPGDPSFDARSAVAASTIIHAMDATGFVMEPGSFLLAWTSEYVELPNTSQLAARVEGKSSIARLGIGIHITAPTIHAGFKGEIQLEMFNVGPNRVRLIPGMRICQLIFEKTTGEAENPYAGQYADQRSK